MHLLEPFFLWRGEYVAEEDPKSPFFEKTYNEIGFEHNIYNYVIHPQWDFMGSSTLFIKLLYVDYQDSVAIFECLGEWNDAIENDIMILKREVVDSLTNQGVTKFIVIMENVLNFHYSDDCYYEEWFDDAEDGWIALVNMHDHVQKEFKKIRLDQYLAMGGELDELEWRTYKPHHLVEKVNQIVNYRLT